MPPIRPSNNPAPGRAPAAALALILAALLLLAPGAVLAQTYEVITDAANIRSGAGSRYSEVGVLQKGDRVTKIGESRGWYEVRTEDGQEGFIAKSLLERVEDAPPAVPAFEDFVGDLKEGAKDGQIEAPGRYPFESSLEYLRIENHPFYVILLALLAAVLSAVIGAALLARAKSGLGQVIPAAVSGPRRTLVKALFLAGGGYAIVWSVVYFLDLAIHFGALEENDILVMVLEFPRLILAAPLALLDALVHNWIVGLVLVVIMALCLVPALSGGPEAFQAPAGGSDDLAAGAPGDTRALDSGIAARAADMETGGGPTRVTGAEPALDEDGESETRIVGQDEDA